MKPRAILLGILAVSLACGACRKREESLSLLVWEGYSDESAVHDFEQSHHCRISASYMGSSDELVAKLRGGSASNYDVISPSSDVAAAIARTGLAAPLDLSKLPSYPQLSSKLRDLPLVKTNGQVYGDPVMWGPNPLLYDTTVFAKAPDSWAIFWDPKYQGKISVWDDLSTVYMAAQILGYDKPDPSQLYNLNDQQLGAVKKSFLGSSPTFARCGLPAGSSPIFLRITRLFLRWAGRSTPTTFAKQISRLAKPSRKRTPRGGSIT